MTVNEERLQKVIAQSGITSRRKAEQLILEGKVKVNGQVVTALGTKVSKNDQIEVNDVQLEKEAHVYYMLYKPRGVISSVSDDKGRKVVTDLLEGVTERVFPIGRLDYDTSGILLLTNDGDFAHHLMHPKYEVEKVYVAKLKGIPTKPELEKLRKGVKAEKDLLKAADYNVLSVDKTKNTMILEIKLREGKNRHVRRMMEQLGYPVMKLKREQYGMLTLTGLKPGKYRALTLKEVKQIRNLASEIVK
ncbi:pseudouridine synthase [Oceanobacillus sp. 143]|uniref:Pseudouridine synthase n=1 Tax=Oceanobacillus zhaokaii TaxID=2052660 RepID=A0A345PH99_9BACI|nr:pseudouridine synthase [Oceanobacillus zhaokaii]AXI09379.1 pseudouridine synthase [Oceanobacillus zhaokaii]QGS68835.1 pseudouridine synthase [Oceanobacillus sp. 143]